MLQVFKSQLGQSMQSVRRFLEKPIKLDDGNIRLGVSDAARRAEAHAEKRRRVRRIKADLYELLGQHPASRRLMRHLALVERTVHSQGLEGLDALSLRVVAKALAELENLVRDWSAAGLADLRSRMAVIVKNRQNAGPAVEHLAAANATPSSASHDDFDHSESADVIETGMGMAEFEEMERSWVGVIPAPAASAAA
jgi:hypothetical protein